MWDRTAFYLVFLAFVPPSRMSTFVEGELKVRGSKLLWKRRWFILDGSDLRYYTSKEAKDGREDSIGTVNLWSVKNVTVEKTDIMIRFLDTEEGYRHAGLRQPSSTRAKFARFISLKRVKKDAMVLRAPTSEHAQRWIKACFSGAFEGQAQQAFSKHGVCLLVPIHEERVKLQFLKILNHSGTSVFETYQVPEDGISSLDVGFIPIQGSLVVLGLQEDQVVEDIISEPISQADGNFTVSLVSKSLVFTISFEENLNSIRDPYDPTISAVGMFQIGICVVLLAYALNHWLQIQSIGVLICICSLLVVARELFHVKRHQSSRSYLISSICRKSKGIKSRSIVFADDTTIVKNNEIGSITSSEATALTELKERLSDLLDTEDSVALVEYKDFLHNDFKLVRFLRARNNKIEAAEKMFRVAMQWRCEYDPRNLHKVYTIPNWLLQYAGSPGFIKMLDQKEDERLDWYFRDKNGNLAVYFRSGPVNWKMIYKKLGRDGEQLFRAGVFVIETVMQDLDRHYIKSNISSQITIIFDLKDFQMSNQVPVSQALSLAKRYLGKLLDCYPEFLSRVLVINAPWLFLSIWNLFKPFFPKELVENKIKIFGSTGVNDQILKLMPSTQVPESYGGELSDNGDPFLYHRIPPLGPFMEDKGISLLKID